MGAKGSTLRSLVSTTEGVAYSTRRKHAAKELQAANKALSNAAAAYADALRGAGSSLVVFCAGTSLYAGTALGEGGDNAEAQYSHEVPQSGPLLPPSGASNSGGPQTDAVGTPGPPGGMPPPQVGNSGVSPVEAFSDGAAPNLNGEQEASPSPGSHEGLSQQDRAFFSANDFPLPPSQPADSPDSGALPGAQDGSAQMPLPMGNQMPGPGQGQTLNSMGPQMQGSGESQMPGPGQGQMPNPMGPQMTAPGQGQMSGPGQGQILGQGQGQMPGQGQGQMPGQGQGQMPLPMQGNPQSSQPTGAMPVNQPPPSAQGPPSYPPEGKPWEAQGMPPQHMSMQLSAPNSGPIGGDKALDQYAKQLNDLFLESAALTGPLIEALGAGARLDKTSMPPLSAEHARGPNGQMEPLGQTLQKLVNWERKLKEDIKVVDVYQNELRKKDKRLERQAGKLLRRSTKDTQRMEDARAGVNDVTARLAATTASLGNTIGELEAFKADLLLQQVLRLLPMFASLWQLSSDIFTKQQQLALQLSMQEPPQVTRSGSLSLAFQATNVSGPLTPVPEASAAAPGAGAGTLGPVGAGAGTGAGAGGGAGGPHSGPLPGPPGQAGHPLARSKSAFARAIGVAFSGTTKSQHEATKRLEEAFKRINTAKGTLNKAQKGFCTSLMMWASKTKAVPSSFPKPAPRPLLPAPGQLPLQQPQYQQPQQPYQQQQPQFQQQQPQFQQQQPQQYQQQQQPQYPQPQYQPPQQQQMQQQMQLMVLKGDVFTALPNDWIRMLDTLPDGELQSAISSFCGWLSQAYNLQKQEMKASKRVLEATRLLDKVEQKLAEKQAREHELRLVLARSGEMLAGHEKEYHVKEQQLLGAANDVASARAMVEAARDRNAKERIGLERLIAGGKVAVAAALQRRLAVVFQQASTYATTASQGFTSLQRQHAPWLSEQNPEPAPNMNPAPPAPPSGLAPNTSLAQAA